MKIEKLIERLQQMQKVIPNADVKLHDYNGNNALFVVRCTNKPKLKNIVWIEDKSDIDMREELSVRFYNFHNSIINDASEYEFFKELVETGITINDIYEHLPEEYLYSKEVMEKYNLITL